jgi:hypothetical protein
MTDLRSERYRLLIKVIGHLKRTLKGAATMKQINVLGFGSRRLFACENDFLMVL